MKTTDNERAPDAQESSAGNAGIEIHIFGLDLLNARTVRLKDRTPVASQIAQACGYSPDQQVSVIQWLTKSLEDVSPNENANLGLSNRFIVVESDGSWRLTVDGLRFDWPAPSIGVAALRKLAEVPDEKSLFIEHTDVPDEEINNAGNLDLRKAGVERIVSRSKKWQLNVQGVILTLSEPTIIVRDALLKAGINPDQGWQIFLKSKGNPKESLTLDSVVDLRAEGIEKLRVSPKDVGNGDSTPIEMRSFALHDVDEDFLDRNYPEWDAITEGGRQWLVLQNYVLPDGYSAKTVSVALEIPPTYPATQIDMFYLYPPVGLVNGVAIPAAEVLQTVLGQQFQRWSRHRGAGNQWNPSFDNVVSHLALVEAALFKEVLQ